MPSTTFGPGGQYALDVDASAASPDVGGNRTPINGIVKVRKIAGTGFRTSNPQPWRFVVNGVVIAQGVWTYDFRYQDEYVLWAGPWTHIHNPDGTATPQGYTGFVTMDGAGEGATGGTVTPATIPRASTATFRQNDGWFVPGTQVPIDTNRASASFTHDIAWAFGTKTGTVANGVGASVTWTPPMDLLTEIPNAPYGNGHITVTTKNGSTIIGRTQTRFFVSSTGITPTITAVAAADDNPNVASLVGAFVQGMSLLKATVQVTAQQGATVPTASFTVDGKTAPSGGSVPLDVAGTRPVTAAATDSRGQSATWAGQIDVLPYGPPEIVAAQVRRATAAGAANEEGTYLRVDLQAAVSSLVNGTQRNALGVKVFTRQSGTTTWIARNVLNPAGLTYNAFFVVTGGGIFEISRSYDVRVDVSDKFGVTQRIVNISTSPVLMHFNADVGVGIKKRHERGALDVGGDAYVRNGSLVQAPGVIDFYGGETAPPGALLCQGQAVARASYPDLFAAIGTAWGAGNGSTTFNVPDLRGRTPVGLDPNQTEFNAVGKRGGAKTATITEANLPARAFIGTGSGSSANVTTGGGGYVGINGQGNPLPILGPYGVGNFIIWT